MNCAVIANTPLAEGFFHLSFAPDTPLGAITPGQFVMVRCSRSTDPLLRRPMSVADCTPDGSRFGLLIQVAGKGTKLLSELVENDRVDVIGPFGGGFDLPGGLGPVWIVAGGTGVAPFMAMAPALKERNADVTLFLGARTGAFLLQKDFFTGAGFELRTTTEDGSEGGKGLVTGALEDALGGGARPGVILTCGPTPMMRAVAAIAAREDIRCYASLENQMACGFGACLGCVAKAAGENRYMTVCRKGPVFDTAEVEI